MMREHALLFGLGGLSISVLSGCPMTDDYFIDAAGSGNVALAGTASGGSGGRPEPDKAGMGGAMPKPMPMPGGSGGAGGANGTAGSVAGTCVSSTERCNGHDDNCNELVDEQACNSRANSTIGCAGFVIPSRPNHGYMLCSTTPRAYAEAQQACEQQSMRLAWLETRAENDEVSTRVHALTTDEVTFGATDIDDEGSWVWDGVGGFQFWQGDENGGVVDDAFAAWTEGTPNDDNGGEDCAVLNPTNGVWGDRACSAQYAYLCEEPE